ncbi:hypothetical protein [Pseudomonas sp. DR 5-09]|uniref:hypothetical protein n=1 Tax=Pseudomonas sp. DR 5-09 TaxID=1534110 RepID=UPI0007E30BF4|nr:hypothetical protein [Pseudomonas sp. DR 5-09]
MFKEPLALLVFIHKDLADYNKDDLYDKHFSWLVEEMENISGRKMLVRLISPSEAQDLSDHPYQNDDARASLREWTTKVSKHHSARPRKDLNPRFNKYLLLTRYPINDRVLGAAHSPGFAGIASIEKTRTAAHEVGHMFNATHEDGEILYNGWWSETIMLEIGGFSELRPDANRYSDKNRENIQKYLDSSAPAGPGSWTFRF